MPHSQGLSINPYLEPYQFLILIPNSLRSIVILSSHVRLGLPKGLFPVKMLKALLPSLLDT
jgi:hypothetical protein